MKKLSPLLLPVLAVAAGLCWFNFPWSSVIEKRVAAVSSQKLVSEFDRWQVDREQKERIVQVETLPPSLRALKPVRARLDSDGLYLVMKHRFVDEDGVFIALLLTNRAFDAGSDPAWFPLGERVYRYHISG